MARLDASRVLEDGARGLGASVMRRFTGRRQKGSVGSGRLAGDAEGGNGRCIAPSGEGYLSRRVQ